MTRKVKTYKDDDNGIYEVEGMNKTSKFGGSRDPLVEEQKQNARNLKPPPSEQVTEEMKKIQIENAKKNKPKGFIYKTK